MCPASTKTVHNVNGSMKLQRQRMMKEEFEHEAMTELHENFVTTQMHNVNKRCAKTLNGETTHSKVDHYSFQNALMPSEIHAWSRAQQAKACSAGDH